MTITNLDSTHLDPALSHTRGETDVPLLTQTIPENLAATVEKFGDRDALVDVQAGRRWTYDEFLADVRRLASGLHRLGIGSGDRVGIWSPNRWEWVLVQYATAEIGAILVNINPAYRVHELEFVLTQAGIKAVVAAPQFKDSDYTGMLAQVQPDCPDLELVVLFGDEEWEAMVSAPTDVKVLETILAGLQPERLLRSRGDFTDDGERFGVPLRFAGLTVPGGGQFRGTDSAFSPDVDGADRIPVDRRLGESG